MFKDTVKIYYFAHPLFTASCSRMNSPVNQSNRFLMVSFLILLRSLRVNGLLHLISAPPPVEEPWNSPGVSYKN